MPSKLFSVTLVLAGLALGPQALQAQEVSQDIIDATVGEWLIAPADGSPGCHVRLEKDRTIGGMAVTEEKPCGAPWTDQIAAWDFAEPGIVFRDATRKEIIGFQEQEGGPWKTPLEVSPLVYFVPEPGNMDSAPAVKTATGAWVLTDKKGKALCHLTLSDKPSPRVDEANAVELSKTCNGAVRKTRADAWQVSEIQLVIIGGEDWVYAFMPDHDGFTTEDGRYHLKRDRQE